jgi:hypothetical protein
MSPQQQQQLTTRGFTCFQQQQQQEQQQLPPAGNPLNTSLLLEVLLAAYSVQFTEIVYRRDFGFGAYV